ncbi:MAG: S1 RNA-binding domain-containing protein [Thermoproteota archaeon]|nr:S1 RNA-binding domain-containing protein [Candidatus Brockarchaeota archaeon]
MSRETVSAGDLLVCKVKEITDFGLLLDNEEITDKEVFLHVSEIPKEMDLHDFKEGQIIVVKVIKTSRTGERIFVSMRQLSRSETRSILRKWRAEKKALEILNEVAEKYSIPSEVLEDTKNKLVERYGSITEALRVAVMEGENILARTRISEEARRALYELAAKELVRKEAVKRLIVQLYFVDKYGVENLKSIFEEIEKMRAKDVTIEAKVVAAPRYSVTVYSHEPKKVKKVVEEVIAKLSEVSREKGGVFKILKEEA